MTCSATSRWGSSRRSAPTVTHISAGDRVVDPVQHLAAATAGCATASSTPSARRPRSASRARAPRCSATPSSTARCPAGRRSTCACRRPTSARSRCREGPPDERFLFLSDVLPTAWQARRVRRRPGRRHAGGLRPRTDRPDGCADRRAPGARVIAVDLVPERLEMAQRHGIEVARPRRRTTTSPTRSARLTERPGRRRGRSTRSAWRRTAHRSRELAQKVDGPAARRGRRAADGEGRRSTGWRRSTPRSTRSAAAARVSIIGVYGGKADPIPMMELFDKRVQMRMGQANVQALDRRDPAAASRTTPTRSASRTSPPTGCRWTRPRAPTRCSRRRRTARSRS